MLVVYGVFIISLFYKSFFRQLVFLFIYSLFLWVRKRRAFLFLCLGILTLFTCHFRYSPKKACGLITQTFEGGYVIEDVLQKYTFFSTESLSRYERICVSGEFNQQSGTKGESHFQISKPSIDRVGNVGNWWKSLDNAIQSNTYVNEILYGKSEDLYTSISLQLSSFFWCVKWLFKSKLGSQKTKILCLVLSGIFMILFGISFGLFRIALKFLVPIEIQILTLLIVYPGYAQTASFLIPFGLHLMNNLSSNIIVGRYSMVYAAFVQSVRYTYSILEHLLYPVMKWLYAPLIPLIVLSFVWEEPIQHWYGFLVKIQGVLNSDFIQRFNTIGYFPFFAVTLLLGFKYLKLKKSEYYFYIMILLTITYYPLATTTFIDVGQGDAILMQMPFKSYTVLIDTGRKTALFDLEKQLMKKGVKNIDQLIITHDDLDHSENKERIMEKYGATLIDTKGSYHPFLYEYLDNVTYTTVNDNSLILMSIYGVLLTGDASRQQERDLVSGDILLCPTVLKLGHHGSKTSTDESFLEYTRPQYTIVSSKPSVYGHPHSEVMRSLYNFGIPVLQTSIHGSITFTHLGFIDIINTSRHFFGIIKPVIKCLK